MIIDMNNLLVGRVATRVAKMLLEGQQVHLINCDKAVFSGTVDNVLAKYVQMRNRTVPLQGPYIHRSSDMLVKRVIRGMIPYKTARGREAFERLKCYVARPATLEGEVTSIKEAEKEKLPNFKYVSVRRVSEYLGGRK